MMIFLFSDGWKEFVKLTILTIFCHNKGRNIKDKIKIDNNEGLEKYIAANLVEYSIEAVRCVRYLEDHLGQQRRLSCARMLSLLIKFGFQNAETIAAIIVKIIAIIIIIITNGE